MVKKKVPILISVLGTSAGLLIIMREGPVKLVDKKAEEKGPRGEKGELGEWRAADGQAGAQIANKGGIRSRKNAIERENPSKIKAFRGRGRGTAEVNQIKKKR